MARLGYVLAVRSCFPVMVAKLHEELDLRRSWPSGHRRALRLA
jgi:hypothetical protein